MTINMHREQKTKNLELFGRLFVHAHYVSLGCNFVTNTWVVVVIRKGVNVPKNVTFIIRF
mgnify:CR=1 FL=1